MTERTRNQEIAQVILQQLGGRRFLAMTGAKNLLAIESGLSLKLPSAFAKDGINYVKVELDDNDTYRLTFQAVRVIRDKGGRVDPDASVRTISETELVYADSLCEVFERHTGLALSLGRVAVERGAYDSASQPEL